MRSANQVLKISGLLVTAFPFPETTCLIIALGSLGKARSKVRNFLVHREVGGFSEKNDPLQIRKFVNNKPRQHDVKRLYIYRYTVNQFIIFKPMLLLFILLQ